MKVLVVGACEPEHVYEVHDPTDSLEIELEMLAVRALSCAYPEHKCIVFGGTFRLDDEVRKPDLALVAHDLSHWFVIEVEMAAHSLHGHVLPQVRAFRYGEPGPDCVGVLTRELGLRADQAEAMLNTVPRSVAVVANRRDAEWETALRAADAQLVTVSRYVSPSGAEVLAIDGALQVRVESLGFGQFSATDRSLRFPPRTRLPEGRIQIVDEVGVAGWWTVAFAAEATWITKERGYPGIGDGEVVQIIRTAEGRISLRSGRATNRR